MLRFAPSPTGLIHVGNARVALLNYLFAKKNNLEFILRIDDTDYERSKKSFTDAIKDDLNWLGIQYDYSFKQSDRLKIYEEITEKLKQKGKIYPCYETPDELELKRKILLKTGKPPIYDRSALSLTLKEKKNFESSGRKPHWRLFIDNESIEWNDLIHKMIKFENLSISDPVLIRSDNNPLFTLTSVVDDIDYKISHIFRGDDHITNTAAQIKLFQYLDSDIPSFGHFPLMKSFSGEEMSKRLNSFSLKEIRKKKINPDALNTLLSKLGTPFPVDSIYSLTELSSQLDLNKFSLSSIKFNYEDLFRLNSKYLRDLDYKNVRSLIKEDFSESFWTAIKSNIENIDDILLWLNIIQSDKFINNKDIDDIDILKSAEYNLPVKIDENTWSIWTKKISRETGKKGKSLYSSIRLAITGLEKGPEMNLVLPLINRNEIIRRLQAYK